MAMPDIAAMMGGGAPGGMPGPGMPGPGMPGDVQSNPLFQMGMAALNGAAPGNQSNETTAMQKVEQALDLAHKLVMNALPLVGQWNPKLSKDLHTIGRQIVDTKLAIQKETPPQFPPAMLSGGVQAPGLGG